MTLEQECQFIRNVNASEHSLMLLGFIQALISAAGEHGFEQLELEVVTENRRAISLYQKMGFRICGTLPDNMKYKDGTYADVYWMMRKL